MDLTKRRAIAHLVCATRDASLKILGQGYENGVLGRNPEVFQGDIVAEVLIDVECSPVEISIGNRHSDSTIVRIAPGEGW